MSRLGLRPIKPPVEQLLIFSSGKVAWHGTKDMFQWHIIHHKTHIDYCLVKPCPLMRSLWLTLCSMSFIYYWLSKSQCLKITQGINCVNFLREGIGVVLYECSRNGRAELGMMWHITCLVWTSGSNRSHVKENVHGVSEQTDGCENYVILYFVNKNRHS